jgi:tetratricopeptide (TPR) repeat protein
MELTRKEIRIILFDLNRENAVAPQALKAIIAASPRGAKVPLMDLYKELDEICEEMYDEDNISMYEFVGEVKSEIEELVNDRNDRGKEYEKNNNLEQAIKHFKASVDDHFEGSLPYDRLYDIYMEKGKKDEAVKVLEAYIQNIGRDIRLVERYERMIEDANKPVKKEEKPEG